MSKIVNIIFIVYLAIVTLIGLVMSVVSTTQLVNAGLKTWVFTYADVPQYIEPCDDYYGHPPHDISFEGELAMMKTDEESTLTDDEIKARCDKRVEAQILEYHRNKAQDSVWSLSVLTIGIPLFLFHYRLFKIEYGGGKKDKAKDKK